MMAKKATKKKVLKKRIVHKKIVKKKVVARKVFKRHSRAPSQKHKHSKVAKMIKLAKARVAAKGKKRK